MDTSTLLILLLVGVIANLVIGILLILRDPSRRADELLRTLRDELRLNREEGASGTRALRDELRQARDDAATAARAQRDELAAAQRAASDLLIGALGEQRETHAANGAELRKRIDEFSAAQSKHIQQLTESLTSASDSQRQAFLDLGAAQRDALTVLGTQVADANRRSLEALEALRASLAVSVKAMQDGNEQKLEQMRLTVDEKLHGTLEKRLGESFKLVSERLEAVQRGLGEMQTLATGVGDLKRVLTNVKLRGTWGEVQLRAILEQILTPDQFVENYQPLEDGRAMVEFAIRLPGRDPGGADVFLPIDSKFPQEDYLRVVEAAEAGDADGVVAATAALVRAVRIAGQQIREKYLHPPSTTDFGILFLPTEGLYAEVLRQPGLAEELHQTCSVVVAGPTTLAATLNSLRMGFRTLAIEQRSSEVWQVLGAVKTEFQKFGDVLVRVKKQLTTATNTIDETTRRTRAMERKLRSVEELPAGAAPVLLELPAFGEDEADEEA